jgi:hypothetical protein
MKLREEALTEQERQQALKLRNEKFSLDKWNLGGKI